MGRLDGRVAVITAATSGIGQRTAEIFVAEGGEGRDSRPPLPEDDALAKNFARAASSVKPMSRSGTRCAR